MRAPFAAVKAARAGAEDLETLAQYCGHPNRALARDGPRMMRTTAADGRVLSARQRRRFPAVDHDGRVSRRAA